MQEDLIFKPCVCGKKAKEVIRYDDSGATRVGWYCSCKHFDKAVGREKIYKKSKQKC